MNWLKRLLAPTFFPGSGRHAATEATAPVDPTPTPKALFLDPYAAGEDFAARYPATPLYGEAVQATGSDPVPLANSQAGIQEWKGSVR